MAHTPGPWSVDPEPFATAGAEWLVLGPPDKKGKHVGIACAWKTSDSICTMAKDKVGQANARLIAAAPELLEACVAFVRAYRNDRFNKQLVELYETMQEAIRKATSE